MQPTIIHIPEPCHENWEAMQPAEQGRFCLSCQKQVVDFSVMTDQQVVQYFQQGTGNTCGRFAADQLQRPIVQPLTPSNRLWAKWVFQLLFPAFLFTQKAKAQKPASRSYLTQRHIVGKPAAPQTITLKGKITDSLTGDPLPSVAIQLKGTRIGVVTDSVGCFKLSVPTNAKQVTLITSYVGYKIQEISVTDFNTPLNILLSQQPEENVVTLPVYRRPIDKQYLAGGFTLVTANMINAARKPSKPSTIKRISNALTGNNHISVYPKNITRGDSLTLNMKKVQKDNYRLQLFSSEGNLVQQEIITVPSKHFNFHWQLGTGLAAGEYVIWVSNAAGQSIYHHKIVVM